MIKTIDKRHCDPAYDGLCRMLMRAIRIARNDAKRGDLQAAAWLDAQCPAWRQLERRKRPK